MTEHGKPRTEAGFINWFHDLRSRAGLPDGLSPHGLRKAFCRVAAEAGLTPHEIMSISGHTTLKEVTRYTAAADRKRMAVAGMKKIEQRTRCGNPPEGFPKTPTKLLKGRTNRRWMVELIEPPTS
jgi:integrase